MESTNFFQCIIKIFQKADVLKQIFWHPDFWILGIFNNRIFKKCYLYIAEIIFFISKNLYNQHHTVNEILCI